MLNWLKLLCFFLYFGICLSAHLPPHNGLYAAVISRNSGGMGLDFSEIQTVHQAPVWQREKFRYQKYKIILGTCSNVIKRTMFPHV